MQALTSFTTGSVEVVLRWRLSGRAMRFVWVLSEDQSPNCGNCFTARSDPAGTSGSPHFQGSGKRHVACLGRSFFLILINIKNIFICFTHIRQVNFVINHKAGHHIPFYGKVILNLILIPFYFSASRSFVRRAGASDVRPGVRGFEKGRCPGTRGRHIKYKAGYIYKEANKLFSLQLNYH